MEELSSLRPPTLAGETRKRQASQEPGNAPRYGASRAEALNRLVPHDPGRARGAVAICGLVLSAS
jgi:hypothetical protein